MKRTVHRDLDPARCLSYRKCKTSTLDVALSLEKLIKDNYSGIIEFLPYEYHNSYILFDEYSLALMIKSIIKELTLKRTVSIFFENKENTFSISFKANEDTPPSEYAITHLTAEAMHFGLELRVDGLTLSIVIPTDRYASYPIYARTRYRFLHVLLEVFRQDEYFCPKD